MKQFILEKSEKGELGILKTELERSQVIQEKYEKDLLDSSYIDKEKAIKAIEYEKDIQRVIESCIEAIHNRFNEANLFCCMNCGCDISECECNKN